MRSVNKAYGLPNPRPWRQKAAQGIRTAVARLKGLVMPSAKTPARVSSDTLTHTAQVKTANTSKATHS